jgi:hypothetical protein
MKKNKSSFELTPPSLASFLPFIQRRKDQERRKIGSHYHFGSWRGGWIGWPHNKGLQFYTFLGISLGIKRRNDRYWQKITFYFFQNVWKCTVFSHLHLKFVKSAIMTLIKFFVEKKNNLGTKKNTEFYADFKFADAGF